MLHLGNPPSGLVAPGQAATPMEPLWNWSPAAVAWFVRASALRRGRKVEFDIRSGLNMALLEDLPLLAPAIVRYWIDTITAEDMPPRNLTVRSGDQTVVIPVTQELLVHLLQLPLLEDTTPEPALPPPAPGSDNAPVS